ncbi:MAG: hypothetical protein Q9192_001320 [Flavoplaca navasiana]
MLPFIVLLITTIPFSGYLMSRVGYYKPWYLGGSILALIGGVLMSTVKVHTSTSAIYGFEVLLGIGTGAYTQAAFAVVQAVIPSKDAGSGITLMLIGEFSLTPKPPSPRSPAPLKTPFPYPNAKHPTKPPNLPQPNFAA